MLGLEQLIEEVLVHQSSVQDFLVLLVCQLCDNLELAFKVGVCCKKLFRGGFFFHQQLVCLLEFRLEVHDAVFKLKFFCNESFFCVFCGFLGLRFNRLFHLCLQVVQLALKLEVLFVGFERVVVVLGLQFVMFSVQCLQLFSQKDELYHVLLRESHVVPDAFGHTVESAEELVEFGTVLDRKRLLSGEGELFL